MSRIGRRIMTRSRMEYKRTREITTMSDHTFEIDLVTEVSKHIECFETHLNPVESCTVPEHSVHSVQIYHMLEKEPDLPSELRVYLSWKRDKIRLVNKWAWFAPNRIFQMHHEKIYIIAQRHQMASVVPSGFVMYDPKRRHYILKVDAKKWRYFTLAEVIVQISKNR